MARMVLMFRFFFVKRNFFDAGRFIKGATSSVNRMEKEDEVWNPSNENLFCLSTNIWHQATFFLVKALYIFAACRPK